ncbi:adhesion G protein-coupled receptor E3-like [Protopterus annectens]|uniref:adhesion G protein-coupled receptor E3-like n=1 Tax=Protopterus annectens TaxID=7888 RepID=UPI001CFA55D3|nr:adhesion G protein-coupled receptor E3-like [Protopterus annectens]
MCTFIFRTQTVADNLNSTQERCNGQLCHCCHESQNKSHPQCSSKLILKKSQLIIDRITSVEFNTTTTKQHSEERQNKVTSLLQDVEQSVLDDTLSALNSNGTKEEILRRYTDIAEIVAHAVPANSDKVNETVILAAGNVTMTIKIQTLVERTEKGVPPVAVLILFKIYDIESVLSRGRVDDKEIGSANYKLNSKIITATISSKNKNNFSHPIIFTFLRDKTEDAVGVLNCVFWKTDDTNRSYWSRDGCFVSKEGTNKTHVTCECNHLSSFAVLLAHVGIVSSRFVVYGFFPYQKNGVCSSSSFPYICTVKPT